MPRAARAPQMAPAAPRQLTVRLPENEEVARCVLEKWRSMADQGDLPESQHFTLAKAYRNVCGAKEHIRSIKDLSQIKGVGQWVIRLIRGSFPESSPDLSPAESNAAKQKGKKTKGPKQYVPQKNSAAYAILITLYRETAGSKTFMKKQELIDAAEASGLSQHAIGSNKSKAKPGSFGSSPKDWYTGWSCVKTLISKDLVTKSSNPARYKLTEEGKSTACDCLLRSGLDEPAKPLVITNPPTASHNPELCCMDSSLSGPSLETVMTVDRPSTSVAKHSHEFVCSNSVTKINYNLTGQEKLNYSSEVQTNNCGEEIILSDSDSERSSYEGHQPLMGSEEFSERGSSPILQASSSSSLDISKNPTPNFGVSDHSVSLAPSYATVYMDNFSLAMPPRESNENFQDVYDVVLILDDRENFGRSRRVDDNIRSLFHVAVEIKHLPVGDGIWIARHRKKHTEYVLDFIVERKNVSDLASSIRDNRYRDQKLRLKKCGLKKLIYLVEGDPNPLDASESIKTACFTTEILEGFDVQRTTGYADTERKYGHLTHSIVKYYSTYFSTNANSTRVCPTFDDFKKTCDDLAKISVSEVFALQLMQVPQVTEEAALAIVELYPTLFSLAQAYSMLGGDTRAQEEMLKNKSRMVNAGASRNIFKVVWSES